MKFTIELELDIDQDVSREDLRDLDPQRMSKIMAPEIQEFASWFMTQGQSPLIGVEMTILKTYLAWKIRE